jgi:hypothetical protein
MTKKKYPASYVWFKSILVGINHFKMWFFPDSKHGGPRWELRSTWLLYAACSGNSLPTFRDNLSVTSRVPKRRYGIATTRCVIAQKSAVLICFAGKAWNLAFRVSATNKHVNGAQGNNCSFWESLASTKCQNGEPEVAHASCHCTLMG